MTLTALFRTTVTIASVLLGSSAIILIFMRSALLWARWFSWLLISATFAITYHLGEEPMRYLMYALCVACVYEFLTLRGFSSRFSYYFGLLCLLISIPGSIREAVDLGPIFSFLLALICSLWKATPKSFIKNFAINFSALFIITFAVDYVLYKEDEAVALLLLVACFDIGSYIGGKTLSRFAIFSKKIFPKTSPNKTYIGVFTGALAAAAVMMLLQVFTFYGFVVLVVGAVLGDYLESRLKRSAGVKDAGDYLPGFGGFLDRFDSYLMLIPFMMIIF